MSIGKIVQVDELKKELWDNAYAVRFMTPTGKETHLALKIQDIQEIIDRITILDENKPTGQWIVYGRQGGIPITDMCSNCNYEMKWYKNKYNYCPNCGAKMTGDSK